MMRIFAYTLMFFILFGVFSGASGGILGYYLYSTSKRDIVKLEKEARNVAETLADASSKMAELGRGKLRSDQMNQFFKYNLDRKLFYKAFFVLENGTIEAHSSPAEVKELKYNIAVDEFRYNLEQIYRPIQDNSKSVYFVDYFLIDKKIPFRKIEIKYLKKYVYNGIDRNGWLANKSVYEDGRAVGTVNFLIAKDKVYSLVRENMHFAKHTAPYLCAGSFVLSLLVMVFVAMSPSSKRREQNGRQIREHEQVTHIDPESINIFENDVIDRGATAVSRQDSGRGITLYEIEENGGGANAPTIYEESDETIIANHGKEYSSLIIQDAIPVRKRR